MDIVDTWQDGRYLLDADHSHGVLQASGLTFSDQLIVDFAGAENDSLHL